MTPDDPRPLRRAAQTVTLVRRRSLQSVFPCAICNAFRQHPPVLISFTRVPHDSVGTRCKGTQHRLPLRVTLDHRTLKANVGSRGLFLLLRSPFRVEGKPC
ncbi:hypothetical protein M3J09_010839 [Ascochyta lentis]